MRSAVWLYFIRVIDTNGKTVKSRCQICKKTFQYYGNTSNMIQHVKRCHPFVDTFKEKSKQRAEELARDTSHVPVHVEITESTAPLPRLRAILPKEVGVPESLQQEIDSSLVKMVTVSGQLFPFVASADFRAFCENLNPSYKVPSQTQLCDKLIPDVYSEKKKMIDSLIGDAAGVSITTNTWSSGSSKSYMTITCHFSLNGVLHSYDLSTKQILGSATVATIGEDLKSVFQEWRLAENVVSIVTDNSPNVEDAISAHLFKSHHPCVADSLFLCVKDSLDADPKLKLILDRCTTLVTFLKQSNAAANLLRKIQAPKNHSKVQGRNSTLVMIEELLHLRDSLCFTISLLPNAPQILDDNEWDIIADCVNLIKPFESTTAFLLDEKYSTVPALIHDLLLTLKDQVVKTESGLVLKNKLVEVVDKRLGSLEKDRTVSMAAFLDPRFKKLGFNKELHADHAQNRVCEEISKIKVIALNKKASKEPKLEDPQSSTSASKSTCGDPLRHFKIKAATYQAKETTYAERRISVRQYVELPLLEREQCPLQFWEKHKSVFPELYLLANKYLTVPATSRPSERYFPKPEPCTDVKIKMSPEILDQLIFLKSALKS